MNEKLKPIAETPATTDVFKGLDADQIKRLQALRELQGSAILEELLGVPARPKSAVEILHDKLAQGQRRDK